MIITVISALGAAAKNVVKHIEMIDFKPRLDHLQEAHLLGTARITGNSLDYDK